jgi:hypothetical protein
MKKGQHLKILINTSPSYALNKICSEASTKLLHVSTPGCHHQGVIQSKEVEGQHALSRYYVAATKVIKTLNLQNTIKPQFYKCGMLKF